MNLAYPKPLIIVPTPLFQQAANDYWYRVQYLEQLCNEYIHSPEYGLHRADYYSMIEAVHHHSHEFLLLTLEHAAATEAHLPPTELLSLQAKSWGSISTFSMLNGVQLATDRMMDALRPSYNGDWTATFRQGTTMLRDILACAAMTDGAPLAFRWNLQSSTIH